LGEFDGFAERVFADFSTDSICKKNRSQMKFNFTTAGESHGKALIAIVEGLPAGLEISVEKINYQLWRRQQGYGRGGRMKIESDKVEILSGVRHGKTLGSPVAVLIENRDFVHWDQIMSVEKLLETPKMLRTVKRPRPGHADLAGGLKFQTRDLRDILERASARETAARVACGAIAQQLLEFFGIQIRSHVVRIGNVPTTEIRLKSWEEICAIPDDSPLRCADKQLEQEMIKLIDRAKEAGDTLGGVFEVVAKNLPVGLGSHVSWREKLDGQIAQAIMSIHAVKAVEIGEGVANASKFGSEVHDEIVYEGSKFKRLTNRAGGLEGGITNGEELRVRGYMKPISTLRKPLRSVDIDTKEPELAAFERSDVTAVPAAGVIGEAMLAIVLANAMREKFGGDSLEEMMRNFQSYCESLKNY
jgi:chorismate synthase